MRYEAYTDGSFKSVAGVELYASAAIIAPEGSSDWTQITLVGSDPEYLPLRNVAGELFAVIRVCEYCLNTLKLKQDDLLRINHDYVGIANWLKSPGDKDYWRCKKEVTQTYRNYFYTYVKPAFKVEFNHTQGHTGNRGNEIVDRLAKEAIEKRLAELLKAREQDARN